MKRKEDKIRYIAKEQIEAQLFLTEIVGSNRVESKLPNFVTNSLQDAERAAESVRSKWLINNWPIESITSLLEEKGVFIVDVECEKDFDGLSGRIDDNLPLIITANRSTIDRKRLSISHELAHLVLKTNNLLGSQMNFL